MKIIESNKNLDIADNYFFSYNSNLVFRRIIKFKIIKMIGKPIDFASRHWPPPSAAWDKIN